MRTYEYPLGVTFRASTPEHAAARVFGGKPGDYLTTTYNSTDNSLGTYSWVEVSDPETGEFIGDIPVHHL